MTAQPSCDSEAFAAARDAYRTIENNINELEVEIDYNQTNLNNTKVDNNDGTRAEYTIEIVEGERYYVVERGYIVRVPDYNGQDEDETIINRPDNYDGKAGRRARGVKCITTGSYKNYLEGNIYSGPEWESSEEGVVAKDRVIWDEEYIFDGDPCDIYDFKIDNSSDAIIVNKDQEQINADKEALAVLDGQRAEALQTFAGVASSCGNVQLPNSRLFKQAREEEPINTIPYLQFVFPGDLQTLSVQERVLVVNRTVPVTMSKDISTVRYPEGYVEVTGVAGARVYSFRVDVKDVEAGFSKMRASKLIIAKSPKNGKTPCDKDGTKLFENISQGTGKNLVFELNTRSSQLPVDNDKPEKGYKCKYTSDLILQNGGEGWKKGDLIEVEMSGVKYVIEVSETIQEDIAEEFEITSNVTAADGSVEITVKMILDDLLAKFNADAALAALGFKAKIIGNGIYVWNEKGEQFGLVTNEWDVMNTFGNFITDVGQLPTQCKAGFITKVSNSAADEDDYYLQFYGSDGKPVSEGDITPQGKLPDTSQENYPRKNFGSDGPGAWYECAKPGLPHILNHDSMPHQIRKVKGVAGTEFLVQPINWADREVGDDVTNPIPRFVGLPKRTRFANGALGAPK